MKTHLKPLGTLLVFGLLAIGAQAATLFQDNFDEYSPGPLTNQSTVWVAHSGAAPINIVADPTGGSGNALQVSQALAQDVHANLDANKTYADISITNTTYVTNNSVITTNIAYSYAFSASNSVSTLYSSYTIYVTTAPPGGSSGANQTYFGHFYSTAGGFNGRVFLVTNGVATPGTFRVALQNSGTALTNTIPVDLSVNTTYTLVSRYVLSTGSNTLWLNPANETSGNRVTPLDAVSTPNIMAYAFRQASAGEGILDVDNLLTGTKFADVVPGSVNPPTILTQPQDTNVFSGSGAIFSTLAAGDATLAYQWYSVTNFPTSPVTNSISGATSSVLTLTSVVTNQSGLIFAVVTNNAGTNVTRSAAFTVSPQPVSPTIDTNIFPAGSTNVVGDTVTFSVVAHGLPAPAYQWKFITNSAGTLITNIVASGTGPTLTLTSVSASQAGTYFVTITNAVPVGYTSTNSALAVLKINPPPSVSIATLRGMVDPGTFAPTNTTSLFTTTGIVTTWTNLSVGGCEFFMQDNSGGICVYWSGAAVSNLPPFGAKVQVTAPLAAFNNLLELEPYYTNALESVTVISTNNQPTAQPLPFDPNVVNSLATMQKLEGSYFVASNVTLTAGATFTTVSAGEPITANTSQITAYTNSVMTLNFTNIAGETFVIYINGYTDIPGQSKPTGPVTIYGVMGNYKNAFQFTPSRFADVVTYFHATNVLSQVVRYGDSLTNSYMESFLEPGETLTTYVSVGDPLGGTVTLTTPTGGLPASASWSNVTSGPNGTAIFHFTPASGDAGSNYIVSVVASSTSGSMSTNSWSVYVPTSDEQKMSVSEFLANPTTNSAWPNFNPLNRSTDTIGIVTNDQYIEVVNLSANSLGSGWTIDSGNAAAPIFDSNAQGNGIPASSAIVIYGGNFTESPRLPVTTTTSGSLLLPTSGTGVLVFRNQNGYIIDRVVYSSGNLSTNSSLSRFPTANGPFVPQAYVSTNYTTAGRQYDGRAWNSPAQIPAGVTNVSISVINGQAVLHFTAKTSQASTLWTAGNLTAPFKVICGQSFQTTSGVFTNTGSPSVQFYYLTTQTNAP